MIVSPAFAGKSYAVLGLARSGLATVEALLASGAAVMAWDQSDTARAKLRSSPANAGEELVRIADPLTTSLYGYAGVVVSPGVPLNRHPIAGRARAAKVPVIGDIELFAQARPNLPPHKVVGITGTNGKSTTTALIHHMLKTAGVPTIMAGNIGAPILGQAPLTPNEQGAGVYVLELSSYQIDLTQSLDCDVAVLLNVTPDHLDRYDGVDDYAASKARLFLMQSPEHVAVIAAEDDFTRAIAGQIGGRRVLVGSGDVRDQSRWPSLKGPHNAQNVAAAVASSGSPTRRSPPRSSPFPGCRTGWSGWPRRMACCSSTIPRRPIRPRPRRRWLLTRRCTGSSAGFRNRTTSTRASRSSTTSRPPTRSAKQGRCSRSCWLTGCR
jgi:UDP-N-acetylmuramoylalanine--D-glutamate ligase